jgi:hypothetical protein
MTNTPLSTVTFSNYSFAFIVTPRGPKGQSVDYIWGWLPDAGRGFLLNNTTNWIATWNGVGYGLGGANPLTVGVNYDLIVTAARIPPGLSNRVVIAYTNSVQTYSAQQSTGLTSDVPLDCLGNSGLGSSANIYIKEIMVWTNAISSNDVVWLHNYTTNKYGL